MQQDDNIKDYYESAVGVEEEQDDAINIAIAAQNNGLLLSLPVSEQLKKDIVVITSELEE